MSANRQEENGVQTIAIGTNDTKFRELVARNLPEKRVEQKASSSGLPGPQNRSVLWPLTAVGSPRPGPSSLIAPAWL